MLKRSSDATFCNFFRPSKQKLWKNPRFLTSPRCNSAPSRGPKPCKKTMFLNTRRKIHCKLQGHQLTRCPPVLVPGVVGRGGGPYNLWLDRRASGKDTGEPSWPAPGFKGLRLTAGRRPSLWWLWLWWWWWLLWLSSLSLSSGPG